MAGHCKYLAIGPGFLGLMLTTNGASAVSLAGTADRIKAIARDLNLQQDLPGPKGVETYYWQFPDIFGFLLSDIALVVLYAAIAALVLFALWTIRDRLPIPGKRRLVAGKADAQATAASVEKMVASQLEADDLAGAGRIAEAMHTLLLRSLTEIRKILGVGFGQSLTSREILQVLSLPGAGRVALADIVSRVEPVYFADRAAVPADYAACRQSYVQLIEAMRVHARTGGAP